MHACMQKKIKNPMPFRIISTRIALKKVYCLLATINHIHTQTGNLYRNVFSGTMSLYLSHIIQIPEKTNDFCAVCLQKKGTSEKK